MTTIDMAEEDLLIVIWRLRTMTICDPSVGSGVFPYYCLLALRNALGKLGVPDTGGALTRDIIGRQLYGIDINPMAVDVTKMRLTIAAIAAEDGQGGIDAPSPPDLDGHFICADTLELVPGADWDRTGYEFPFGFPDDA